MEALKAIWEDDISLFYLCACIMAMYQIFLWKKQKFYNFSKEMEQHVLSSKYRLNRKCNADLDRINRLLALANICAILISCVCVSFFGFKVGLITLAVLFVIFNWIATAYLGNYYN